MSSIEPSIQSKALVLVLGAGASNEVNLPVGADLKHQIAKRLDIRFEDGYHRDSGDDKITQAFRIIASENGTQGDINPLLDVSWLIRDAMPQAISIDNFIDSHRDNDLIALCGKLAITRCILEAEAGSILRVDRSNIYNKVKFGAVANTWFNAFFQLLTENCQRKELPERLQRIAVVSFNYDRCIEHYLYHSLQNYYAMPADEAARMVALLEMHHPYGKVGSLPWMSQSEAIEYGDTPNPRQLIDISKQLRTFTEGTDPSVSHIDSIRATIASAERLVFLGFAFHRLNLDLLFSIAKPEFESRTESVFATAYGISESDSQYIRNELKKKAKNRYLHINMRTDLTCANLFSEYWRSLSLS